jgi:hypothetical protein
MRLFCDCKTDEEKSNFFLSGMAVETGVIAPAISNDVAMAYQRCAQFKKENDALRAKIEAMEKQEPVAWMLNCPTLGGDTRWILSWTQSGAGLCNRLQGEENEKRLYALPGAKGE